MLRLKKNQTEMINQLTEKIKDVINFRLID